MIHVFSDDEAIELCELYKEKIQLLLTDLVMPGMGGVRLSRKLSLLQPRMKVLFMSGYSSDVIEVHGLPTSSVHFIQKLFLMISLLSKVRGVLDHVSPVGGAECGIHW